MSYIYQNTVVSLSVIAKNKLNLTGLGLNSLFKRVQAPYSITTDIIIKYNKELYILVKSKPLTLPL